MGAIIAIVMLAGRAHVSRSASSPSSSPAASRRSTTLDSLQRMMEAHDERQVAMRSIVPEIRAGHIELTHVSASAIPTRRRRCAVGPQPQDRAGRADRRSSAGSPRASRRSAGCCAGSMRRPTARCWSMASTAANITRTSCATPSASSARTPSCSAAPCATISCSARPQADDQQLIDAVVRSGADIFLSRDAAGFDLPVGERGSRLSGGQRSLLVLARALVSPSKLLFLDEPTGAMDTQTELYFIEHLKTALAPDQTLVVSTHRHNMLSICRPADRHRRRADHRRRAARRGARRT